MGDDPAQSVTAASQLASAVGTLSPADRVVWLLAPGIAAIGIAYAYGPGVDPAWELASSMPVSDRMVLLVRSVAVFAVNACLGLVVSGISYWATANGLHGTAGHDAASTAAALTFAWLIPMTAVCALTLAVAVVTRSAAVGALTGVIAWGVIAWGVIVLASRASAGAFSAAVTSTATYVPYLAVAACATAVIGYTYRLPRRTQ